MKPTNFPRIVLAAGVASSMLHAQPFKLVTLDPGHFHAALVQKSMSDDIDPAVTIFAPAGPELDRHLALIEGFNTRRENPTAWKTTVVSGADFLDRMLAEQAGDFVVISGNNARKSRYILEAVKAGYHVLADKPMAIDPGGFALIEEACRIARDKKLLLLDIMTERHEITTILQKELSRFPDVFGELDKGTPDDPSVTKESVHHFSKLVNGAPLQRPGWFFDPEQQGEAIVDVTTHLVDLVQWECFPGETLRAQDIEMLDARVWNTELTRAEFSKVTRLDGWPESLKPLVGEDDILHTPANGGFTYRIKGVHARVSVRWDFEASAGSGDTHDSLLRGTKCSLHIRQGKDQNFQPVLYIEPRQPVDDRWTAALEIALTDIAKRHPGVTVKRDGERFRVAIPEALKIGHEAHFGQVTERFLSYLNGETVPAWEVPNTLVKYNTLMQAWNASR